jgi:hypothetical protein
MADRKRKREPLAAWPFPTEYGDHFSTTSEALVDLATGLDILASRLNKTRATLRLYDPFYCDGSVKDRWGTLGFTSVLHDKRDFYADVTAGCVPDYDVLVTNPPYSSDHKERIVSFCASSGKPFCLLLPNYVATKLHYRTAISELVASQCAPVYFVPASRYRYLHPDGTGYPDSPFESIWYAHFGPLTAAVAGAWRHELRRPEPGAVKSGAPSVPRSLLAFSIDELAATGKVPTQQRPSSKQRKRLLKKRAALAGGIGSGNPSPGVLVRPAVSRAHVTDAVATAKSLRHPRLVHGPPYVEPLAVAGRKPEPSDRPRAPGPGRHGGPSGGALRQQQGRAPSSASTGGFRVDLSWAQGGGAR